MSALSQPVRRALTVDEYHRMGEIGIFAPEERVELIEGEIITMVPIGSPHAAMVSWLAKRFFTAVDEAAIVWTQNPIRLSDTSEPEPDLALLAPRPDFYNSALPAPEDVFLLVEVAQTSLAFDRDRKAPMYASAGVPELWIVDLAEQCVIRFRDPESGGYRDTELLDLSYPVVPSQLSVSIEVNDIFPVSECSSGRV